VDTVYYRYFLFAAVNGEGRKSRERKTKRRNKKGYMFLPVLKGLL